MRERPEWMDAKIRKVKMPCGSLFVAVSYDTRHYPREVFLMGSKLGTCKANLEANGRQATSQLWESRYEQVLDDLKGVKCYACERTIGSLSPEEKQKHPLSCPDCVARTLQEFREIIKEKKEGK